MKHLVLFSLIIFCFASVWAEEVQMNATAKTYNDNVKLFAQTYLQGDINASFNYNTFLNNIESTAKLVNVTKDDKGDVTYDPATDFKPQSFMDQITSIVDEAVKDNNTLNDSACGSIKKDYLYELSFFLEGYIDDMQRGGLEGGAKLNTDTYVNDIRQLTNNKKKECQNKKNPPAKKATGDKYKPEEHLDAVLGSAKRVNAKIDFVWEGMNGFWLNRTLANLVESFKDYFAGNQVALADIALLEDIWPQGSEVYTMNASYGTDYDKQPNNYYVNEYGALTNKTDAQAIRDSANKKIREGKEKDLTDEERFYHKQFDELQNPNEWDSGSSQWGNQYAAGQRNDHCYNNRQYGYSDGNKTTIKLTTNGREYTLQQHFFTSPIILDMDGDGKVEASKGKWLPHNYEDSKVAEFDMDGDGFIDLTEWVGPNDGLLLVYKNNEVNANDLFGTAGGFNHGYEKLSLLDENGDGKISGKELNTLSVWQDKNGNAKVDAGEISSLQSLNITSLSLKHDDQFVSSFEPLEADMAKRIPLGKRLMQALEVWPTP